MYYTVYKTTNLLNGQIYIGVHRTENLDDNYLGSGDFIIAAIEVYGKENFKKEILSLHESKEAMYAEEKRIVNRAFVKRLDTYNLTIGGKIPPDPTGLIRSEETKKKIGIKNSINMRGNIPWNKDKIDVYSKETRKLMSERQIGITWVEKYGFVETEKRKLDLIMNPRNIKQVLCIETGIIYKSINAAGQAMGTSNPIAISNCINGKRKLAYGYTWALVN